MNKLKNCVLGAVAAVTLGTFATCRYAGDAGDIYQIVEGPVTNEKFAQDFKNFARQRGIEDLTEAAAMDSLVQYVNSNLGGKTLASEGTMTEDEKGIVKGIKLTSINIDDMNNPANLSQITTSVKQEGAMVYPDGTRTTSKITINKDEIEK